MNTLRQVGVLGPRHRRVTELRRLIRKRSRGDATVVLEGARTVGEALAAGMQPSAVAIATSAAGTEAVRSVLSRLDPAVEVLALTDQAFESVAPAVSPQPVLALINRPDAAVPGHLDAGDLVLVLVGVSDPGNVGTIIRTAEGCGARCVIAVGGADPWAPKAVRASAGAVLRVPVVTADDAPTVLEQLRTAGTTIVAADSNQGEPHHSGVLRTPDTALALVLGSESVGLDPSLHVDRRVRIPLAGEAESLNVAMAATVLAFEHRRPAAGRS